MPPKRTKNRYGTLALLGGCLLTGSLGSIHAFSVFIQTLEGTLSATRAQISALYSFALVCLTLAVLFGHHLYRRFTATQLAFTACAIAALGLLITGYSRSLYTHIIGYSVLFGGANGIGYGLSLYVVSRALPERTGMAMGVVTAVYALGATLFAKLFELLLNLYGLGITFACMAGLLLLIAIAASWLFSMVSRNLSIQHGSITEKTHADQSINSTGNSDRKRLILLWLGYGFGVVAGLMAIGHATGLVESAGGTSGQVVAGAMLIGLGNAAGGFTSGWFVDRYAVRQLLLGLSLLSGVALLFLAMLNGMEMEFGAVDSAQWTLVGLTLIGFCYGAIIAIYPAATVTYYGPDLATKLYGRIFTAWGLAGLFGPWLAGFIFDSTGGYVAALGLASFAALLSAIVSLLLPTTKKSVGA